MNAVIKDESFAARILNVSQKQYFSDPCVVPSLSQSIAHVLVSKSPLHAWHKHPRLGGAPESTDGDDDATPDSPDTKSTANGKIIHALVLGRGEENIEVFDFENFKMKQAREARDSAIAEGRTPIVREKFEEAVVVAQRIKDNLLAYGIELDGESEVAGEWYEEATAGRVLCRGLVDHLRLHKQTVYDFKSIRSAHPVTCARHLIEYGYDIQQAAYKSFVTKLHPDLVGRLDFVFLFAELTPPYAVLPVRLDGKTRECGEMRWSRAVHLWQRCLERNHWPSYSDGIVNLGAPDFLLNREMDENDKF